MQPIHGRHSRVRFTGVRFGVLCALVCGALLQVLVGAAEAAGGCVTTVGSVTCTFDYTGATQTWTVPNGVTQVTLDVFGAQGGDNPAPGGQGGRATATITVTPGETLTIVVGGRGHSPFGGEDALGGFNGGGNGGAPYNLPAAYYGSGGGGGSDVRIGGTNLAHRAIVAGGGGGAANVGGPNGASFGGAGGGLSGGTGNSAYLPDAASGGAGGNQNGTTGSGQLGLGSNGVNSTSTALNGVGAGGGGGGYYGGAGGAAGTGGGGGSGFGPVGTVFATGGRAGDGQVLVTYTPPKSDQVITFSLSGTRPFGTTFAVSATSGSGGTVTFTSTTPVVCAVSGTTVTPLALGTCTIAADQAGDASYNAAPQVTRTVQIVAAATTTAARGAATYGDTTATLTATVTANGQAVPAGGLVRFTFRGVIVGTAPTNNRGVATLAAPLPAGTAAGTYANQVMAEYLGTTNYLPNIDTGPLVVGRRILWVKPVDQTVKLKQSNPTGCTLQLAVGSAFLPGDGWGSVNTANLRCVTSRNYPFSNASETIGTTYKIAATGVTSANYDIRYLGGTLTVVAP